MKKILVDLNILIDFLNKRNFHLEAAQLINSCVEKENQGFLCAHEITTLSYFLFKNQKDKTKLINTITSIMDIFTIIPVNETILKDALLSPINDFEDAVVEVSALKHNIDYIISRNISDFKNARISAYTPEQFTIHN